MRRITAGLIGVMMIVLASSCWRPGAIQIVFDQMTPTQQYAAMAELNDWNVDHNWTFTFDNVPNKLYFHGYFPANDNYPSNVLVDHATTGCPVPPEYQAQVGSSVVECTWRGDIFLNVGSNAQDIRWGIDTVLAY